MDINVVGSNHTLHSKIHRFARMGRNLKSLAAYRESENAARFDSRLADLKRADSAYAQSSGLHLARELEHIYTEVMRNDYPDNNALSLFPIDRSVPAGARSHTVQRLDVTGKAQVHRGRGDNIPAVSVAKDEESFPVLYYTIGVEWDHFEEMASDFASSNLLDESLTGARDIMLEFWNQKTWFGDEENGLYGVLNYPYINKYVMSATFAHGGSAEDMLAALQRLVDFPGQLNRGKQILQPNTVLMSIRAKQIIEGTYFSGVQGETVLSRLEASKGVKVVAAWELQGTGPGGSDQFLVYKAGDKRSVANVSPLGFTQLPTREQGFDYQIPCFMAHGGVIMRKALMNVLGYATVSD